jgi:hypothetical protein
MTNFVGRRGMGDLPAWIVQRLDRAGWIDAVMGASRYARAARCPSCDRPVLRGLTEFPGALSVDVDPHPLTLLAETACVLLGRRTYELRYVFGFRYELDSRDRWRRRERRAGLTKGVDVLAVHQCGKPPPPPWAATMLVEPHHDSSLPEEPDF